MATYKVLEPSFIGNSFRNVDDIVEINDDVKNGGMEPGSNLAACDADGNLLKAPKAGKKAAAESTDSLA